MRHALCLCLTRTRARPLLSHIHTNTGAAAAARAPRLAPADISPQPTPARSTASLPASPPQRALPPHPLAHRSAGRLPERPRLPDAPGPVRRKVFPSHHSLTPTSLPRFAEGPTLGMGTSSAPLLVFLAPLLVGCARQKIGPLARSASPSRGLRGVSTSPCSPAPAASLQVREEDGLPPAPTVPAFLSAQPSSATGLRAGNSGPRCSKDSSPANGPGIWRA
ncbi:uncharacterized protein LOC141584941 [Saimiri boliviensis]|uniref:uncharacterized protein LOC141584941 n=1 Tax=Saimiri boliviensis TaxID=27679 RepID=UPI003D76F023